MTPNPRLGHILAGVSGVLIGNCVYHQQNLLNYTDTATFKQYINNDMKCVPVDKEKIMATSNKEMAEWLKSLEARKQYESEQNSKANSHTKNLIWGQEKKDASS